MNEKDKKCLRNTISGIFMELFLGISQRSCLPFCVADSIVNWTLDGGKQLTFLSHDIHKLRDKFKKKSEREEERRKT